MTSLLLLREAEKFKRPIPLVGENPVVFVKKRFHKSALRNQGWFFCCFRRRICFHHYAYKLTISFHLSVF